ncbi:MBL fold metallo-hydrolase [Pseudomonas knackmussii]|uniref:MBL fold metallo-hydrolase n=1 Tax=Pseudomonas knackmussii TaxID=65741 RepID=UPI003F4A68D0
MREPACGNITVRMYRGILGDCFLLRHDEDGQARHILIDCGVLQGVQGARERMKAIVEDIHALTQGELDLVVVTHEHHDHLSGFSYEKARFFGQDFDIHELWLAWTEDPNDALAVSLHQRFSKSKAALSKVVQLTALAKDPRIETLRGLSAFVEPLPADGSRKSTLDLLKDKAGGSATRYLKPGDVLQPERLPSLKTMVLGPPRDEQRLRKDAPAKGAGREVYLTDGEEAFAIEDRARRELGEEPLISELPFARPYQRLLDDARKVAASADGGGVEQLYFAEANDWRRIEAEWLDGAEAMGLKMDSDTNNTSLVLAFELADRQVLLFPGDAQVGNWLSWVDQTYPPQASAEQPTPATRDDILARVSLYKVGHHGSHNATLREFGLEKMTSPRLVAMLPLVEAVAQQNEWQMPYPDLFQALQQRTEGRIVSGDGDPAREKAAFAAQPSDERYPAQVAHDPNGLWVEVSIPYEKCRH